MNQKSDKPLVGFPLPMKRMAPSADGSLTQNYRPLAVLEFINEKLRAPAATSAPVGDLDDLFGAAA